MTIDKLFGLPAHPLLVHIPVVFVPLAALGAVTLVTVPRWRRWLEWPVAVAAVIGAVGSQLAAGSGERLLKRIDTSRAIEKHAALGRDTRLLVAIFAVAVVAFVVVRRRRRGAGGSGARRRGAVLSYMLSALVVVSGVVAAIWMVRTGHQGALVTWKGVGRTNR
jgi:uncharacterized membrane protein